MGIAVSAIHYPPTLVRQDGPRGLWYRYVMSVPAGMVVSGTASGHRYAGPVDFSGEGGFCENTLHVSNASTSGFTEAAYTVLGTFDEPSTTPTDRNWFTMRGDTATGKNVILGTVDGVAGGVTNPGLVAIRTVARSFLFRISSATAVTAAVRFTFQSIKSNG